MYFEILRCICVSSQSASTEKVLPHHGVGPFLFFHLVCTIRQVDSIVLTIVPISPPMCPRKQRTVDRLYVDRTFGGQDWFGLRQRVLKVRESGVSALFVSGARS